jgi:hypothetical protein
MVHASQLRPYYMSRNFPYRPTPLPQSDAKPASGDWIVERILGSRFHNGSKEFLIKWVDHPDSDSCWIPGRNLENAHQLILDFDLDMALGTKAS